MMKKSMVFAVAIFAMLVAGSFGGLSAPTDYSFSYTDPAGDVTIPDIDITQVSSHLENSSVMIELVVSGNISDSSEYTYIIKLTSDPTAVSDDSAPTCLITYTGGTAIAMTSTTSYTQVNATVSPHTLTLKLPTGIFEEFSDYYLESASAAYSNEAVDTVVPDYGASGGSAGSEGGASGGSSGSVDEGSSGSAPLLDPATETPTDTSVSIKITDLKVDINKVDNGQNWHYVVKVDGTTSGVDHVSLNFVVYYTDGTKDISGWMEGPWTLPSGTFAGTTINKATFNATSDNWKTWELNIDMKTPVYMGPAEDINWTSSMTKDIKDLSKVRVYARGFADYNETGWNQDYYEFTPTTTEDSVSYDTASSSGSSGGSSPGFGFVGVIAALSIAGLVYNYRRRH